MAIIFSGKGFRLLDRHQSPFVLAAPKRSFNFRLMAVADPFAMDLLLCFFPWASPFLANAEAPKNSSCTILH